MIILTPVPVHLSIVSPWAFSRSEPGLTMQTPLNLDPPQISFAWPLWQCFSSGGHPSKYSTLLSDNSIHWATVMQQECGEQNTVCPWPPTPSWLAGQGASSTPEHTPDSFHVLLELSDSFQASQVLFRKNQSPIEAVLQRPRGSFQWAILVLETSMVRSIVQISRC